MLGDMFDFCSLLNGQSVLYYSSNIGSSRVGTQKHLYNIPRIAQTSAIWQCSETAQLQLPHQYQPAKNGGQYCVHPPPLPPQQLDSSITIKFYREEKWKLDTRTNPFLETPKNLNSWAPFIPCFCVLSFIFIHSSKEVLLHQGGCDFGGRDTSYSLASQIFQSYITKLVKNKPNSNSS